MRWLRRGSVPAGLGRLLAWLGPLGFAVALAGCVTSSAHETSASRPYAQAERVVMEDDGLPAQVAPSSAIRQQPDDPSEPFSRNYGPRPARLAGPPARMSSAEEEALIVRAIAEHEMRRP